MSALVMAEPRAKWSRPHDQIFPYSTPFLHGLLESPSEFAAVHRDITAPRQRRKRGSFELMKRAMAGNTGEINSGNNHMATTPKNTVRTIFPLVRLLHAVMERAKV